MVDLNGKYTAASLLPPAARTANVNGAAFDTRDYVGVLKASQSVGVVSGTNPTFDTKIQDSLDGAAGWADVAGAAFAQVIAADNFQSIGIDTRKVKRYIRTASTIGGTATPTFNVGVSLVGQKATS